MPGQNYNVTVNYQTGDASALKTVEEIKQDLFEISTSKGIPTNKLTPELLRAADAAAALLKSLDAAENKKLGKINMSSFTSTLSSYGYSLQDTERLLSSIGDTGKKVYGDLNRRLATVGSTTLQTNKFLETAYDTIVKTARWNISSNIVNSVSGSIQRAFGYIEDLDESITNIRIVTGFSADEMEKFAEQANKAAKELGKTTLDYSDAALIYFQQGKTAEQVEKLTDATVKAANVSQSTAEDMSDYLTAVWNGYKISAENSEQAVDKLSAVAAKTGADLSELSIGMSKVASAANNMGVDMDQMNAILATITTVTREAPETVGTTLKTVLSRMTDLTLGEIDEDGIDFGAVAEELSKVGIQIADSDGKLIDLGVTLEAVGDKWSTMTREQQISTAQAMAGTRQYSRLISLYDNWDMYEDALAVSKDAAGTLNEQNEVYLESFEAHAERLSATLEGLWDTVLDSEAMKFGVDSLSFFINSLDEMIKLVGGAAPAFAILGGILTRTFGDKMAKQILNTADNIKILSTISKDRKSWKGELIKDSNNKNVTESYRNLSKEISKVVNVMTQEQILSAKGQLQKIEDSSMAIVLKEQELEAIIRERQEIEKLLKIKAENGEKGKIKGIDDNLALRLANIIEEGKAYKELSERKKQYYKGLDENNVLNTLKDKQEALQAEKILLEKIGKQLLSNRRIQLEPEEFEKIPNSVKKKVSSDGSIMTIRAVKDAQAAVNQELVKAEIASKNVKNVTEKIVNIIKVNSNGLAPYVQQTKKLQKELDAANKELAELEGKLQKEVLDSSRIAKVSDGINVLSGSLMAGAGAASVLKDAIEGNIDPMSALTTTAMSLSSGINSVISASKYGAVATVIAAIVALLPAAAVGIDALVVTEKELREETAKLAEEVKTSQDEWDSLEEAIKSNNDRIKELQKTLENGLPNLVEKQQILDLQELNEELRIREGYIKEEQERKQKEVDDNTKKQVEDEKKTYKVKKFNQYGEDYTEKDSTYGEKMYDTIEESIDGAVKKYNELKAARDKYRNDSNTKNDDKFTKSEEDELKKLEEYIATAGKEYLDMAEQYSDKTDETYNYVISQSQKLQATLDPKTIGLNKFFEVFEDDAKKHNIETLLDGLVKKEDYRNMDEFKKVMDLTGMNAVDLDNALVELANTEDWISKVTKDAEEKYQSFNDALEKVIESSSKVRSGLKDLSGALEEQDENGELSADSIISLVESGYALALSLDVQTGKVIINEKAMQRLAKEKIKNAIANIELKKTSIVDDLGAQAIAVTETATGFLAYNHQLAKTLELTTAMENYNSLNAEELALEKLLKNIDNLRDLGGKSGGGGSKSDPHLEAYEKERAALDHMYAMGRISAMDYYKDIEKMNQKYFVGREKYIDKERTLLEETYKGLKQAYEDILNEEKDKLDKVLSYVERVIDKQIDSIENQKKEIEDYYEGQIKSLEVLIKARQGEIDDLKKANEERQAAIDLQKEIYELNKLNNQRENYIYKDGQMVYENDPNAIREQQSVVDEQMYDAQIKALEDVIELLESQITTWEEKVTASNEAFDKQIESLELYKEKWTAIAEQQAEQEEESIALALYGANMRDQILNGSLDIIQLFSDDYKSITDGLALIAQANADNMGSIVGQMTGAAARAIQAAKDIAEANAKIQASTGVDYGGGGSGNGNQNLPTTSSFSGTSKSLAARISADAKAPTSINPGANKVLNKIPMLSTNTNAFTTINRAIESKVEVNVNAPNLTNASQMENVLNAAFGQAATTMHKKVLEFR